MEEGECEGGGFTGACLCDADDIASGEDGGDSLLLDWSGGGVALGGDGAHEWFGEPEVSEGH